MLDEMIQIRQDLSGLRDGSLSDAVKELQHQVFNTADKIIFKKDDEGRLFYLDSDGNNVTGEIKIDGIPYQFAPNGVLQTGFRKAILLRSADRKYPPRLGGMGRKSVLHHAI